MKEFKICSGCKKGLPATVEFFHKGNSKFGLNSWCKECCKQYRKQYHLDNYEEEIERMKQWHEENKEKANERSSRWRRDNPDYAKQWREEYPDYAKEYSKQYYSDNRDKELERQKQWREGNPDKRKKCMKQWQINNPDKNAANTAKYRATKLQATPIWANEDHIKLYYTWCNIFNILFEPYMRFEVDHEIPLQGENICGLHVENNLQILLAQLNHKKSNKWPLMEEEQKRYKGFRL